jgi:hypothetical protein
MKNRPYRDENKWEVTYLESRLGCAALDYVLGVNTAQRMWPDWLGQDGGWRLKGSWNSGFGSPVFCSVMSLSMLPKDCMKYCSNGVKREEFVMGFRRVIV